MKRLFFDGHGNPNRLCSISSYLLTALIVWIPFLFLMPEVWTIAVALVVAPFLYQRLPWMTRISEEEWTAGEAEWRERYKAGFEQSKTDDTGGSKR